MARSAERAQQAAATPVPPPADAYGFYARLGVVLPRSRRQWVPSRCFLDGHRDRHASASVNIASGVWKCFACNTHGGPFGAAVARGLSRGDAAKLVQEYGLWLGEYRTPARATPKTSTAPTAPIETTHVDWKALAQRVRTPQARVVRRREYAYVDELGAPLSRAVRTDLDDGNKGFWQERYEAGKWIAGLGETRRVLFKLPEVLEHSRQGGVVVLAEGEKTVEAIERLGVVATTSPAGAGKWHDSYADSLVGATVCVAPDCDLPGRKHMLAVARSLLEHGIRVVGPLELDALRQDGHDLADHLADVAKTVRAVEPGIAQRELRRRLRVYVERLIRTCLPATSDSLRYYGERAEFRADPRGRVWRHCERCGRDRPHSEAAGVLYCVCGALVVP